MQPSQMYTPGPAISLRTSSWVLPQNVQASRWSRVPRLRLASPDAEPAAGTAGLLDDLVHSLVAEPEAGGQLAQGRAVQVQAPDGPVEIGACHLDVAFGVDQPLLSLPGLGQQVIVHAVYCN